MPRRPKVKLGDNYKETEKETECAIEQRLISKSTCIVEELETNLMSLVIFITLNICSTRFEH